MNVLFLLISKYFNIFQFFSLLSSDILHLKIKQMKKIVENKGVEPLTFPIHRDDLANWPNQYNKSNERLITYSNNVENKGVEPLTSWMQIKRSSQLS